MLRREKITILSTLPNVAESENQNWLSNVSSYLWNSFDCLISYSTFIFPSRVDFLSYLSFSLLDRRCRTGVDHLYFVVFRTTRVPKAINQSGRHRRPLSQVHHVASVLSICATAQTTFSIPKVSGRKAQDYDHRNLITFTLWLYIG